MSENIKNVVNDELEQGLESNTSQQVAKHRLIL